MSDPPIEAERHGQAGRVRVRSSTAVLALALIAVAGVYGGARLEQGQTSASTSAGPSSNAFAARRASGPAAASGAGVSSGTVTELTGKTLYLTSSSGALVKVKLTAKTTFTHTARSAKSGLRIGDSAIVQGTRNAAGTIVATTVIATAKGVTSSFGVRAGAATP